MILCGGNDARFVPKKVIVPDVSRTRPEIARSVVLLPAPVGAQQADGFALADLDADVADRWHGPVTGAHAG